MRVPYRCMMADQSHLDPSLHKEEGHDCPKKLLVRGGGGRAVTGGYGRDWFWTITERPDAGSPAELPDGDGGAAEESRRRELADDPSDLRWVGLQPAQRNHAGQCEAVAAGVGFL